MNYVDLIIFAILHDIGEFIIRTDNKTDVLQHQLCAEWTQKHNISDVVSLMASNYQHLMNTQNIPDVAAIHANELFIVYEADNLSSGNVIDKHRQVKSMLDTPLMSVFSKISMSHNMEKANYNNCWCYHELGKAGGKLRFPGDFNTAKTSYGSGEYKELFTSFEKDFVALKTNLSIDAIMVILEKYTSYIPLETSVQNEEPADYPDVSLFDHLKTTAAIAACLYKYVEETTPDFRDVLCKDKILDRQDQRYMFVGGDFSGVQKFIYTISSKGALKTLRARSFFLELLTEHVVSKILSQIGLTRANIIYAGGGKFYLLAPNTQQCKDILNKIGREVNSFLYNLHRGQLYLSLEHVVFSGDAFIPKGSGLDIAELWTELRHRLNLKKKCKFIEQIESDPDAFWEPKEPALENCSICHKDYPSLKKLIPKEGDESIEVCSFCKHLYELGDELPDARYIVRCNEPPRDISYLEIDAVYYAICSEKGDLNKLKAAVVYIINSWSIGEYILPGTIQLFIGNYTIRMGRGYKSFDQMAKEATGANRIGVLRVDVDNLGNIFTRGLPTHERTFSRLSTLSRNLTHFFKYHINDICRGSKNTSVEPLRLIPSGKNRNITVIYAGGDDLFLVGAWDDVAEVAFDIENCFRIYTGCNPDVTISGGVVVQDEKYPLYKFADIAGEAEERAKDNGRDSISLFYVSVPEFCRDGKLLFTGTYKWKVARRMIDELLVPAVRDLTDKNTYDPERVNFSFSKGFMYRLVAVADIWRREGVLYLPRLAYTLAKEDKVHKDNLAWDIWKQKLYNINFISNLRTLITWMDLLSRRGDEDGRDEKSGKPTGQK